MTSYQEKTNQELAFFTPDDVMALPPVFKYWVRKHLVPMLNEIGLSGTEELLWRYTAEVCRKVDHCRIYSLGAGNCANEIELARKLVEMGITNFTIECGDINLTTLARGPERAPDVADYLETVESDMNTWQPSKSYDVVLAVQCLHHCVELEHVFEQVRACLKPGGYFLVNDMIGRNGHQRWPEALEMVHEFWQQMPGRYRYNQLLQRYEDLYENWDCSTVGFEGIRAQDILTLLIQNFSFDCFMGFGNLIDIFVERCFGPNFYTECEWDRDFIDRVHLAGALAIEQGRIKPTQMVGALTLEPTEREPILFRGQTPEFCVRNPLSV
jgi:SAM-dependent methyltransferase